MVLVHLQISFVTVFLRIDELEDECSVISCHFIPRAWRNDRNPQQGFSRKASPMISFSLMIFIISRGAPFVASRYYMSHLICMIGHAGNQRNPKVAE